MNVLLKDGGLSMQDFSKKDFMFWNIWNECLSRGEIGMKKTNQRFMGTFF
jgi:hypothetical protein